MEQRDIAKFHGSLTQIIEQLQIGMNKERDGIEGLDEHIGQKVAAAPGIEIAIEEIQEALEAACRIRNILQKATSNKSLPWWTQNHTNLRKKVNEEQRKFQRTKDNHDLRDHRKEQYMATKAELAAAIRRERYTSMIGYCTMTSVTNPWSGIYRILAGRDKRDAPQTTLKQKMVN